MKCSVVDLFVSPTAASLCSNIFVVKAKIHSTSSRTYCFAAELFQTYSFDLTAQVSQNLGTLENSERLIRKYLKISQKQLCSLAESMQSPTGLVILIHFLYSPVDISKEGWLTPWLLSAPFISPQETNHSCFHVLMHTSAGPKVLQ